MLINVNRWTDIYLETIVGPSPTSQDAIGPGRAPAT